MTHFLERSALILLAGTALSVGVSLQGAVAKPVLDIPPAAVAAPGVDAAARVKSRRHKPAAEAEDAATYRVRKGDTLAKVATKLGTSLEALAKANGLKSPYRLDAGQLLMNPDAAPKASVRTSSKAGAKGKTSATAAPESYEVKSGDTLFSISKRFGVSIQALKAENGMGRRSTLARGRKLKIPGSGRAADVEDETPPPESHARPSRATPEPREEATAARAAPGRVITIETAGKAVRVKKGETLERVARRLDSDVGELARINRLKRPYRLRAGQTIRGPGDSAKAYVAARDDTLATVAERFDVTVDRLRQANGLRRGAAIAPGRKLRLPAGYRDRGPGRAVEPTEPRSSFSNPTPVGRTLPPPRSAMPEALPNGPQPYIPPPRRPSASYPSPGGSVSGAPTASPAVSDAQIMQMGRGVFTWPARGQILSGFGDKGAGQRNDGLNIRASAGDPVRAAASGDVVYAGDQVPGFGNLVLIKHADGWVTAYGHLGKVEVRMQQKVTQGQQIGEAGATGGVSEPQLHFEVRYAPNPQERARPIDPALVLPK